MKKIIITFFFCFVLMAVGTSVGLYASEEKETATKETTSANLSESKDKSNFAKYFGAAIAITGAVLASGFAVAKIGSAAMGAISEKPEIVGIALVFVALAEGICLWGFIIAFLILGSK